MELSALQSMIAVQEEELQVQAADLESLTRNIQIKEDLIKVFQRFLKATGNVCSSEYLYGTFKQNMTKAAWSVLVSLLLESIVGCFKRIPHLS